MLTNWKQINKKYKGYFNKEPFTPFEIEIFNSKENPINPEIYNLETIDDTEKLHSLSKYYEILACTSKKDTEKYDLLWLNFCTKLANKGDSRGFYRLGLYYQNDNHIDLYLCVFNFDKASKLGNIVAKVNLADIFMAGKFNIDKVEKLLLKVIDINPNFIRVYYTICYYYGIVDNLGKQLFYANIGILKGCNKCMSIVEGVYPNKTELYIYLKFFPETNELINNKLDEISLFVDMDRVRESKGKTVQNINKKGEIITLF